MPTPDMPWQPRTRSEDGRVSEKRYMRKQGGVAHPMSGGGRIKFDGHTDDALVEHKDAGKSHTVTAKLIRDLHTEAVRQGKDAYYVIKFPDGYMLEGRVTRE